MLDVEEVAAVAGVRAGDEVIAIGAASGTLHPEIGDHVVLRLARDGQRIHVALRAEHPDDLPDELNAKAPAFSTTTVSGDPVSLAELASHVVVLEFWSPKNVLSRSKLEQLATLHTKHPALRIVGISRDELRAEMASLPEYTLVHDRDGAIFEAYDASEPMLVVIDREGLVRKIESGLPDFKRLEAELIGLM